MFARPDGLLDGAYSYLFYEADVQKIHFQTYASWKLPADGRQEAFKTILDKYGFNENEQADFIAFWNEKLDPDQNYLAYPQETRIVDQAMPVIVTPAPDSLTRIWFYFLPSDEEPAVEPPQPEKIVRNGFTLVEWGGMFQ